MPLPIPEIVDGVLLNDGVHAMVRADFAGVIAVDMKHPFDPLTVLAVVYDTNGVLHVPKRLQVDGEWVKVEFALAPGASFAGRLVAYGVKK